MSERPWHTPPPAEVIPPHFSWRANLAMAVGLAVFIVGFRVYKFIGRWSK